MSLAKDVIASLIRRILSTPPAGDASPDEDVDAAMTRDSRGRELPSRRLLI